MSQLSLIGIKKINNQNYNWLKIEMKENFNKPLALFIPGGSKKGEYKIWQPEKFAEIAKYYSKLGFIICVVGTYEDSNYVFPILVIHILFCPPIGRSQQLIHKKDNSVLGRKVDFSLNFHLHF